MKLIRLASCVFLALGSLTAVASIEEDQESDNLLQQVCRTSGIKVGLELAALDAMVQECKSSLTGRSLPQPDPLSDEDVYLIEDQCSSEAQQESEDDFDNVFEQCTTREVIAHLVRVSL